nr:nitrilase-related carbon-nitrogen hydrolase [Lysobacter sp. CAU 1642]
MDRWVLADNGGIRAWRPWVRASTLAAGLCFLPLPFPFTPLAQLVAAPWLLQPAAFGGEYLALALVLLPAAAVAEGAAARSEWRAWGAKVAAPVSVLIALVYLLGEARIEQFDGDEQAGRGEVARIAPLGLDLPLFASPGLVWRDRPGGSASAVELSRGVAARSSACELLVWPELPLSVEAAREGCARASTLATALDIPVLMQCYRNTPDGPPYVSAEWFEPGSEAAVSWHAKSALVPFYERPIWGEPIFSAGAPGGVFPDAKGRIFLPALCYALHSREHLGAGVRQGARAVLHMASFSPFGRQPIDVWDNALARIRAVEFGVPVVTASNRGRPGWVDAMGRQREVGERYAGTAHCLEIWIPDQRPGLGGRWMGQALVWALLGLTVLGLARGFLARRASEAQPSPDPAQTD